MSVLTFNCGSTSLKWALFPEASGEQTHLKNGPAARGVVENIGRCGRASIWSGQQLSHFERTGFPDHGQAAAWVLDWLHRSRLHPNGLTGIGHRIVHGGKHFTGPVVLTEEVLAELRSLGELVAICNRTSLSVVDISRALTGGNCPSIGIFDTAFHQTMPPHATGYPVAQSLVDELDIRRYGFFGLAHRSLIEQYAAITETPMHRVRVVTVHLGHHCSTAAIRNGISVDTTAGLTPADGLMGMTGCGSIDPLLAVQLSQAYEHSFRGIEHTLLRRSGLLGVAGRSSDLSAVILAEKQGDPRAALAVDMFCNRVRQSIAAALATLGGAESIIFSGGIGEHEPLIRSRICGNMDWCGIRLDLAANEWMTEGSGTISTSESQIQVLVIPADEERVMLDDVRHCLGLTQSDRAEPNSVPSGTRQTLRYCPS